MADKVGTLSVVRADADTQPAPTFGPSLESNASAAASYFAGVDQALGRLGTPVDRGPEQRQHAQGIKLRARAAREDFFRRHAAEIYDEMTDGGRAGCASPSWPTRPPTRYPGLLPTRAEIDARACPRAAGRQGRPRDRPGAVHRPRPGRRACGLHLIHAMLQAEARRREAARRVRAHRSGSTSARAASSARTTSARHPHQSQVPQRRGRRRLRRLETAADLVLLDDQIEVGVLRGSTVEHPKYAGPARVQRRHQPHAPVLRADLAHRVLPRARAGPRQQDLSRAVGARSCHDSSRTTREAVAGGGRSLRHRRRLPDLCVMDRVIAEPRRLLQPAGQQGRVHPGLRQPAVPAPGRHPLARQAIFFERRSRPIRPRAC